MARTVNHLYEMQILVRPGPGCPMPPHAVGGEAWCFVGAPDHEEAVRLGCAELNAKGYVCERLLGDSVGQLVLSGWADRAREICAELEDRFPGAGASFQKSLPDMPRLRTLLREGGFQLGPLFCWDSDPPDEPAEEPEEEAEASTFTEEEIRQHNELFNRGCDLVENSIAVEGRPTREPDAAARQRLRKAVQCFTQALAIHPTNWQALLFMGKALTSLGETEQALAAMLRAHECGPGEVAVAVEAGAAASRAGRHDLAAHVLQSAAEHHPSDPRLPCNLGISCLLTGDLAGARQAFARAVELEPQRPANHRLLRLVEEVAAGKRPRPTCEAEIAQALC